MKMRSFNRLYCLSLVVTIVTSSPSSSGCPSLSSLPLLGADNKTFIGAVCYPEDGNWLPPLACNGDPEDLLDNTSVAGGDSTASRSPIILACGSLFVHDGCTFYGFGSPNYQGSLYEQAGPAELSILPDNTWDGCGDKKRCFWSFIVDCVMHMPDCKPEDQWIPVASYDNSQSDIDVMFEYKYTVGTSWSEEMSSGSDISVTVEETMQAGFWSIFSSELGVSASTGYNWQSVSASAQAEETTTTIAMTVPPGMVVSVEQTVGRCDGSSVKTEKFRTITNF